MLSIRPASAGDVPALSALIRELAAFERLPVSVTDASLLRDGFGDQHAKLWPLAEAVAQQRSVGNRHWQPFERSQFTNKSAQRWHIACAGRSY